MLYPINSVSRRVASLDGIWKFKFDEEGTGESSQWQNGLKDAIEIPVPASFNDFFTDKESREYCGDFWYERDAFVPGEWEGKDVFLRFCAATHRAVVYVNGIEAGKHEGGFLPFTCNISKIVKYNAYNRIVVKMNNELSNTSLPAGAVKTLRNGKKMNAPYFDFFNYAGLNRSVYLTCIPTEAIEDFSVVHHIDGNDSTTDYEVITNGESDVLVEVYDEQKNLVASSHGKKGTITISDVHLWQVRNAYLYTFIIKIVRDDEVIDEYFDEIGIRTVHIDGESILINNEPVYLKGFGKHEDSDIAGRGFNINVMKRDFELMKWIGANSFRTSHYPYDENIYRMADKEGFLVIDEVPAVGFMQSTMNFLDASSGKNTSWFSKDTTSILLENHKQAVTELIARDKNRACVIAWSLFNEPETTDPSAVPYFKEIFDLAQELDPQKRPRTFALIMNSLPHNCLCYNFADFISLNRYYGWYISGGYEISDAEYMFRQELDAWNAKHLNKPFIFTEYGADTYASEHKLPSVMWSQEYQIEYINMCSRVFDSYSFVKGEQVWNFADFQTTEGIMRVNGNKKGIFTRQRQPKDIAFIYKQRWESLPLDYKK